MDRNEQQSLKTLSQFRDPLFLRKITQLLVSVSVFSLLLSNSFRLPLLHFFSSYFSTFPAQLFTHTLDKNCIFLLCNGLLVFVAKYSGLTSSLRKHNHGFENYKGYGDDTTVMEPTGSLMESPEAQENVIVEAETGDVFVTGEAEEFVAEHEEEQEEERELEEENHGLFVIGDDEEEEEEEEEKEQERASVEEEEIELDNESPIEEEEEEEEEDEGGNGLLSTEELNKKFEEFIRKMKEEIRIEAQQQLVMVN